MDLWSPVESCGIRIMDKQVSSGVSQGHGSLVLCKSLLGIRYEDPAPVHSAYCIHANRIA